MSSRVSMMVNQKLPRLHGNFGVFTAAPGDILWQQLSSAPPLQWRHRRRSPPDKPNKAPRETHGSGPSFWATQFGGAMWSMLQMDMNTEQATMEWKKKTSGFHQELWDWNQHTVLYIYICIYIYTKPYSTKMNQHFYTEPKCSNLITRLHPWILGEFS